jgi:hypothetical protein
MYRSSFKSFKPFNRVAPFKTSAEMTEHVRAAERRLGSDQLNNLLKQYKVAEKASFKSWLTPVQSLSVQGFKGGFET